jgi:hypothetical protein
MLLTFLEKTVPHLWNRQYFCLLKNRFIHNPFVLIHEIRSWPYLRTYTYTKAVEKLAHRWRHQRALSPSTFIRSLCSGSLERIRCMYKKCLDNFSNRIFVIGYTALGQIDTYVLCLHTVLTYVYVWLSIVFVMYKGTYIETNIASLAAWSSGIASACHRGDWSYASWDRIPPGYT